VEEENILVFIQEKWKLKTCRRKQFIAHKPNLVTAFTFLPQIEEIPLNI